MQAEINNLYHERVTGTNGYIVELWLNELISPVTSQPMFITIKRVVNPHEDEVILYHATAELNENKATCVRDAIATFDYMAKQYLEEVNENDFPF